MLVPASFKFSFKLNFDGSKLFDGNASFDFIIRNSDGSVLLVGAKSIGRNNSVIQAEAWGLVEGIKGVFSSP